MNPKIRNINKLSTRKTTQNQTAGNTEGCLKAIAVVALPDWNGGGIQIFLHEPGGKARAERGERGEGGNRPVCRNRSTIQQGWWGLVLQSTNT